MVRALQRVARGLLLAAAGSVGAHSAAPAGMQPFPVAPGQTVGVQRLAAAPEAPAGAAPIYFIAGGPAVSPNEELSRRPVLFARLQNLGEVVMVEQRGAGSSLPAMDCNTRWALPLDRVPTRAEAIADARRQLTSCSAALRAQGVNLTAYRTELYAADLQAVMRHLGHERVRLVAHSYGTMIALELLRLDAPRIERAVLAGVMGPGDALRDPRDHERVLDTLAADLGLDAAKLRAQVAEALDRAERTPPAGRTADGTAVVLGRDDIARGIVQALGRPGPGRQLPGVIESLAAGRSDATLQAWLGEVAEGTRTARTGPLARRAAAQHYLTVCANAETEARRHARTARSLFGHLLHATLPEACDAWGLPTAQARAPVAADTPVLLVSALLDVRTPHEQALSAQRTLPRATLLTLAGAGHGEVLGPHPALDAALVAFLRGQPIPAATFPPAP
jgi:pimeloyl-ACP methyl ester carboxylesterase